MQMGKAPDPTIYSWRHIGSIAWQCKFEYLDYIITCKMILTVDK
jgi:hypothetical protein